MKSFLRLFSNLSLFGGIAFFLILVLGAVFTEGVPNWARLIAGVTYLVSALVSWAVLEGIAEGLELWNGLRLSADLRKRSK